MSAPCCMNCKYKKEVVVEVSSWVVLTMPHCSKFSALVPDAVNGGRIIYTPCERAMKEFCGGIAWRPNIWYRIKSWINGAKT